MIVELAEYETARGIRLTDRQAAALQRSRVVTVSPSIDEAGAWTLRAAQYVGAIIVEEGLEVRIRPKVPIDRLLYLVTHARDERAWRSEVVDLVVADDIVASMGWAFAHFAEAALARGVLQGYLQVEEALQGMRGRLREADQLRRHFGFVPPVEVTHDVYTVDILENRMLLAGVERLLMLPTLAKAVRARLRHLAGRLDGVGPLGREDTGKEVLFTRLNQHYRPAVRLAQAILLGTSLELGTGLRQGVAFLFDMNKVFEDFVTATLGAALERIGGRVESQCRSYLDERQAIEIQPDLVWWWRGACRAVIDIKYKSTSIDDLPNADVYQAIAYSVAFDVRPAFLVYAAGNEAPGEHVVVHSDLRIVVGALDISGTIDQIGASVQLLARHIISRTRQTAEVGS